MKKLWVFGCSISDLYDSETSLYYWSEGYLKWKGYTPKHYSQIISEELGCELMNYGVSSTNNYAILQLICDNIEQISNDDYVIIQWTETNRFRLSDDNNEWINFVFNHLQNKSELKNNKYLSIQTIQETLTNRLNTIYEDEVASWEKLIKSKLNTDKLLIWYPFRHIGEYGRLLNSIENILTESKGVINDLHFSENGQIHLSNILLNKLNNNNKDII
jgi:hypothetical protein